MAVVINGSDIFVYMDGVKVANATSHTLTINMATRDTSNKDTGKFNTKAVGRMDVSATSDALVVYSDLATILSAYMDRLPLTLHFAEDDDGSPNIAKFYATGDFIITSMDINAGDQENASYSVTFDHYTGFTWAGDTDLVVGVLGTNCSANAADDGFVAAFPRGGTPPYTFVWNADPSLTTQSLSGLAPGTYKVVVTEDGVSPATATGEVTITEPPA
jgi:hypothetical protein